MRRFNPINNNLKKLWQLFDFKKSCQSIKNRIMLLKYFEKILELIQKAENFFGVFTFGVLILLNIYGIFSRYVFQFPVIYVQELTILIAVWMIFVGAGVVFKNKMDIVVEFLVKFFPKRWERIVDGFVKCVTCAFLLILVYQMWKFLPYTRSEVPILSFAFGIPDEIFYYPIAIGAISTLLFMLKDFCYFVKNAIKNKNC